MKTIKFRQTFYSYKDDKFAHFRFWGIAYPKKGTNTFPSTSSHYFTKTHELFTGLKDRNNKNIYEGDIIEMERYAEWEDITYDGVFTGKAVMIASKGACIVNPIFKNNITGKIEKTNQYKNIVAYRSSIIGNIHENKELLK